MRRALACLALLLPMAVWAEDLVQVYRDAKGYDAQYAAARYAQDHPAPLWRGVCAATLLLATAVVLIVLLRTLRSAASRPA